MKHACYILLLIWLNCWPHPIKAQLTGVCTGQLLLQLSSGFITVTKEARIDLDSSLLYSAHLHHLSRACLITEGFTAEYTATELSWLDRQERPNLKAHFIQEGRNVSPRLQLLEGAYYAFQPGAQAIWLDRGISALKKAQMGFSGSGDLKGLGQSLCLLEKCYLKRRDLRAAGRCFDQLTNIRGPWRKDLLLQGKAFSYFGLYYPFLPATTGLRIRNLRQALNFYRLAADTAGQINALMDIAYLSFAAKDLPAAAAAAQSSFQLQKTIRFPYQHYTSDLLSLIYLVNGNFGKQLDYAMLSVQSAEHSGDSLGLAIFYKRLGDCYSFDQQTKNECRRWYRKAFVQFMKNGGDSQVYRLLIDLSMDAGPNANLTLIAMIGKLMQQHPPDNTIDRQDAFMALAESYRHLKKYQDAAYFYAKAEKLALSNRQIRGDLFSSFLLYKLGQFYLETGKLNKSRHYFLTFINDPAVKIVSPYYLSRVYWDMHRLDSAQGDLAGSVRYLKRFSALEDSLINLNAIRSVRTPDIHPADIQQNEHYVQPGRHHPAIKRSSYPIKRLIAIIAGSLLLLILILTSYNLKHRTWRRKRVQINKIQLRDQLLLRTLTEKESISHSTERLLNEVKHRVKNNLDVVLELLGNQSKALDDKNALEAVRQSRSRIKAISLIHLVLSDSPQEALVDMEKFIGEIADHLLHNFNAGPEMKIKLELEPLQLELSQAEPFGLILNEMVTNCFKHAFRSEVIPVICITLQHMENGKVKLIVADNGTDLSPDFDIDRSPTLGIKLMRGLCDQLGGELQFHINKGMTVKLSFDKE